MEMRGVYLYFYLYSYSYSDSFSYWVGIGGGCGVKSCGFKYVGLGFELSMRGHRKRVQV